MAHKGEPLEGLPVATRIFEPFAALAREKKSWQVATYAALAACLILALSVVELNRRSSVEVHVVELDRLGRTLYVGPAKEASAEGRYVVAELSALIRELRVFYSDLEAVWAERLRGYAHVTPEVRSYLADWYSRPEENPVEMSRRLSSREVFIESVLPLSAGSWQVRWREKEISRIGESVRESGWVGVLGVVFVPLQTMSRERAAAALQENPLGLYIRNLSWTEVSEEGGVE